MISLSNRFDMLSMMGRTTVVVVLLLVVGSLLTGPAMAIGSDPSVPLAQSSASSESRQAVLDGPTFEGPWIPSIKIVERIKDLFQEILGGIGKKAVNFINDILYGVPAPGDPTKPATWANPDGGRWNVVMNYAKWTTSLATLILIAAALVSFMYSDAHERRQAWKRWVTALFMILGTWTFLPLLLHTADQMAIALAPSGDQVLGNFANLGKMSVGLGLLIILAIVQPSIIGIGLAVLAVEKAIILFGVAFWPLVWAVRALRIDTFKSVSDSFIFLFGVIVMTKVVQAFTARFLFSLPWGGVKTFESVILIAGGLVFIFVILPWKMLELSYNAAGTSLGMNAARRRHGSGPIRTGGQFAEAAANRVGNTPVERAKAIGSASKTTAGGVKKAGSAAKSGAGSVKSGVGSARSTVNNWRGNGSPRGDGTGNGTWGGNRWQDYQSNSSSSSSTSNGQTSSTDSDTSSDSGEGWKQAEKRKREKTRRNKNYE